MTVPADTIRRNLDSLRSRIAAAAERAGRDPADVTLVAVTKEVSIEEIRVLLDAGVTDLGENRTETARAKIAAVGRGPRWHMIGSIQRRKARDVVELFDQADALDRLSLAEALERRCEEMDRSLDILIEVNISGEASKHGFPPDGVFAAWESLRPYRRLRVKGLMTMAPLDAPEPELRRCFGQLRALAREYGLPELSMGMSGDFEIAVEEGATQVRIGSALYA